MAELRTNGPYIWVTWLTKLLVGENSCEWAGWFQAQHEGRSWTPVPSSFDTVNWQVQHTAAVTNCRQHWEEQGYTTFTENQNSFTLRGKTATLGGKPDLIAKNGSFGTIVDVKTGSPSPAHGVQVMLYLFAVPRALVQFRDVEFDGKVVYPDHEVSVPASAVDDTFVRNLSSLIHRLASSTPARKVPSRWECQYCKVSSRDCPERVESDSPIEEITDEF